MPEFTPSISVSSLNGSTGFRLDGAVAGDLAGGSLANAGDVNGDGRADLLIGARNASGAAGAAYVVLGTASAPPAATGLGARVAAGTAYRFQGELAGDQAGYSVSGAGDVNGDGFADLLIGAPSADTSPPPYSANSGRTYLVFGGSHLEALDTIGGGANDNVILLSSLTAAHGAKLDGSSFQYSTGYAGWAVSGGDINGDGVSDIVIGAPSTEFVGKNGYAYVVFGGAANLADIDDDDGALDGHIVLGNVAGDGFIFSGINQAYDDVGHTLDASGDVNGDGIKDLIMGAYGADRPGSGSVFSNEGAAYIVFGRLNGVPAFPTAPSGLDGVQGVKIIGIATGDQAGTSVSYAGDINGDGLGDVLIGAKSVQSARGAVYVVFGSQMWDSVVDLGTLDGTNGFRMLGVRAGDNTGTSVSNAGDVNGDGFGDILIGVRLADRLGATDSGAAFVVFGKSGGFAPTVNLNSLNGNNGFSITGIVGSDLLGTSAKAVGDLNGDGFADIAIGAPGAAGAAGSTYIVYGHRALSDVVRVGTDLNDRINGGTGDDVVRGLAGNDTLLGWEGDDTLIGGSGNDTFDPNAGDDEVRGGAGNDFTYAALGDDSIFGGSGIDTLSFAAISGVGAVVANLATGSIALPTGDVLSFASIETLIGTASGDTITGNARNNNLNGAAGNDTVSGGAGNDTIVGSAGQDRLTGDAGNDVFSFVAITDSTAAPATADVVVGFTHAADKIDVSTIDAIAGGGTANDTFVFPGGIITGAFTAAGQVRAFQSGGDTVIEVNTTGASGAEMSIVLLGFTAATLTAVDFTL